MSTAYAEEGLFDLTAEHVRKPDPEPSGVAWEALEQIAFIYTATAAGTNSGIRFALSIEDAKTWCSQPESRGTANYGTEWSTFWTSAANFIRQWEGPVSRPQLVTKGLTDDGRADATLAALGLRKIALSDFRAVFEPLGVEVVTR